MEVQVVDNVFHFWNFFQVANTLLFQKEEDLEVLTREKEKMKEVAEKCFL